MMSPDYKEELQKTIEEARIISGLTPFAGRLQRALEKLQAVTEHLVRLSTSESRDLFLADATLYLEFFGIRSVSWQWLLQALSVVKGLRRNPEGREADFYQGKLYAFRYFFSYELPKTVWMAERLMDTDGLTVDMKEAFFSD